MKNMNILMVTNWCYPDRIGGSRKYIFELAKNLVKKGHRVWILTGKKDSESPHSEEIDGVHFERYNINCSNIISWQLTNIYNSFKLINKLLKKYSFDVINLHQVLSGNSVFLSRKCPSIPKLHTFYALSFREVELNLEKKKYGWVKNRIKPLFKKVYSMEMKILQSSNLHRCKKIISLSEYTKRQLGVFFGLPQSKVEVIPGAVDIERFRPAKDRFSVRQRLNLDTNKFILLTVRRLENRMGIDNLIKTMIQIRKRIPNVYLIIVGTGSLEVVFKNLVKKFGLTDYIKFIGLVKEKQLPSYYQAADLFVLPTKELEGFGISTVEALASGTPVIGTSIGGTVEILGGLDKRLLINGTDPKFIEKSIIEFYLYRRREKELSQKCRNYVLNKYTWKKVTIAYEKIYADLLYK